MRRKVISCVICALVIATILVIEVPKDVSAQVTEEWVALHNGPRNSHDGAYDITIGPSGTIYVTGASWGNETGTDCDTVAYDKNGNELWSARYDGKGKGGDATFAITVDSSENIYVTGGSYNSTQRSDYITIAYDSEGNELWFARYDGPANSNDRANAIVTDSMGNIYVTGTSPGSPTNEDYATIKYNSSGNEVWVARWSGPGSGSVERARAITVDSLGNVYVTGIGQYKTEWNYTTIKYDSMGNELWIAIYSGADYGIEGGEAIIVDSLGRVFVTGTSGTVVYDQFGNELWIKNGYKGYDITLDSLGNVYVTGYIHCSGSYRDFFTVKYDSSGNELWSAGYNGPGNDQDCARAMTIDSFGNIFVTGSSDGNGTRADFLTIAYDSNGNELWIARYNGPVDWHDYARGIVTDSSGDIYVTGLSHRTPHMSSYTTIKYSSQGNPLIFQVDIDPDTLNLKSKGRWITCYITLNKPYDVNDIYISTVLLEDTIPAEWGDVQGETLMVKFDRSDVEDMLSPGTYNLKVTGELTDGTVFEGYSDEIRVIEPP